jgi:hypothetical protein
MGEMVGGSDSERINGYNQEDENILVDQRINCTATDDAGNGLLNLNGS